MALATPTPEAYLASLPEDRRTALTEVRRLVKEHLSPEFEEGIQYGMLTYYVPHALYEKGYHVNPQLPLPCLSIASQKNHMALYLMCLYAGSELSAWFEAEWKKTGKKLDMGKSCVRFKTVDDLALDVLSRLFDRLTVRQFVHDYEASLSAPRRAQRSTHETVPEPKVATRKGSVRAKAMATKTTASATSVKASKRPAVAAGKAKSPRASKTGRRAVRST